MNNDLDIINALVKLEKQTNELDKNICKYKDKEIKRLQKRIDKAIEYINDDLKDYQTISDVSANDLLKILRGEE